MRATTRAERRERILEPTAGWDRRYGEPGDEWNRRPDPYG